MLSMNVSGIQSIENEMKLEFYKKGISHSFDPEHYHVKAIYGENGSGKTAILLAVDLMRNIVLDDQYLSQKDHQVLLNEMVNKKAKRFQFECSFIEILEGVHNIYHYGMTLAQNDAHLYVIENEYCKVKAFHSKRSQNLFHVRAHHLEHLDLTGETYKGLIDFTDNLLDLHSMIPKSISYFHNRSFTMKSLTGEYKEIQRYLSSVISISFFFMHIHVFLNLQQADSQYPFLDRSVLHELLEVSEGSKTLDVLHHTFDYRLEHDRFLIPKDLFHAFEEYVYRMKTFLAMIKNDLESIEIIKYERKDHYECELVFHYPDYDINYQYESAGIKRLVALFQAFDDCDQGHIVLIDDMDLHLSSIILDRIIEYFIRYGRGQLIFTLHASSAMNVLRHTKKSIDSLTEEGIVSWTAKGNASVENSYRHGMIDGLPFHIEPEDFLGLFGED